MTFSQLHMISSRRLMDKCEEIAEAMITSDASFDRAAYHRMNDLRRRLTWEAVIEPIEDFIARHRVGDVASDFWTEYAEACAKGPSDYRANPKSPEDKAIALEGYFAVEHDAHVETARDHDNEQFERERWESMSPREKEEERARIKWLKDNYGNAQ